MSIRSLYMKAVAALLLAVPLGAQTSVPANLPPLDADIEITYTLPNGQAFTKRGHIYRGRNGKVRQDSGLGSVITDLNSGTVTLLIAERKEARVLTIPREHRGRARTDLPAAVPFDETTVDGHRVVKARAKGPNGETHEFWTATDLGIVTFSRVESGGLTTTQALRNVSVREPDPSVFQVPKDYRVIREPLRADVAGARRNATLPGHPLGRVTMVAPPAGPGAERQ